jgi:hypothetical protein
VEADIFAHVYSISDCLNATKMDEFYWRQNSFLIDDYDETVQKNDKKMQEAMHQDFYSSTFYSMRKKVKQEYRLLTIDSSEYYFEAMFICAMQNTFCVAYLVYDTDISAVFNK